MTARVTFALASILLSSLALSACVTVVPPPASGISDAEAQQIVEDGLEQRWEMASLPEGQRPPTGTVRFVPRGDSGMLFATCMNDAGFANYVGMPNGYGVIDTDGKSIPGEGLTIYQCSTQTQVDPREYALNANQVNYLYDYYQTTLMPCLARAGYPHLSYIPTRTEMLESDGWNPYYGLPDEVFGNLTEKSQLVRMCPAAPAGKGFRSPWAGRD